jgi:ribokinase
VTAVDVIVVGSLHLDIVVKASHLPSLDETVRGQSWSRVCGGKGGNQACWASKLGAKTAMISRVGDDDFGRTLRANLQATGVDHRAVTTDTSAGSGMSVAILEKTGSYGAVIVSGANLNITSDETVAVINQFSGARLLLLQNEINETVNIAAAQYAKSKGLDVILNAAPARAINPALANCIDILIVNRVEVEMMSGLKVDNRIDAVTACQKLRTIAKQIVITLGAEGLVYQDGEAAPVEVLPHPVTVISTHGAGDCFTGQLAAALAGGATFADSIMLANQTAARFVAGGLG